MNLLIVPGPFHEPYLLAEKVCRIFEDRNLAEQFSVLGHMHAAKTYDRQKNTENLLKMYNTIDRNAKEANK